MTRLELDFQFQSNGFDRSLIYFTYFKLVVTSIQTKAVTETTLKKGQIQSDSNDGLVACQLKNYIY